MANVVSAFLQDIFVYPIKSLGGISLKSSITEERGLPFDRRWLLVDKKNSFLTQRKHSMMSLLQVFIEEEHLRIEHKLNEMVPLMVPLDTISTERIQVNIFDDLVVAPLIRNAKIEEWFSNFMGEEVQFIQMDEKTHRKIDPDYAKNGEEVSFADGYPFMVTSQASLNELNTRLEEPLPMNRFRPNFVIAGTEPWEEDNWKQLTIGSTVFSVVKPCSRCKVTTINQENAEKGQEPLRTLSTYRKFNNKIIFGQNLILKSPGEIKVDDEVKIEYK